MRQIAALALLQQFQAVLASPWMTNNTVKEYSLDHNIDYINSASLAMVLDVPQLFSDSSKYSFVLLLLCSSYYKETGLANS